ncbi:unnamed protein product [Paramecium pentaurelia]|uniref:Uncharacterized protein n=1 Tax=Paramecium pentaurelia TaxID=43138 RepID=A0A8S1YFX9_9CILI|nr:unnamed protein product [Paramecium pentaurelia]
MKKIEYFETNIKCLLLMEKVFIYSKISQIVIKNQMKYNRKRYTFSSHLTIQYDKLLAFGLKYGYKLMMLDKYLNQDPQYINDFSISDDSSLLVLAANTGIRLKNLESNKEIFIP